MNKPTKELPHDLLAEKSLLGCLIIDGTSFDDVSDLDILREDFHHPTYGLIFDCVKDLYISNQPVDYVTICSKLTQLGKLEEIGGQSFILEIVEDQATSANVYHYGKIVKDKSSLRELVRTANRVSQMGMDFTGPVEEYVQEVESSFFKLTNKAKSTGLLKLNTCLKDNLKELEDTSRNAGEISGISSGYPKLDEILLGMQAGQLIVLAARPAMGKTALGLNMAVNAVRISGLPVAIFSLEMMAKELSMRILATQSKVDSNKIKRKNFIETDLRNIGQAVGMLQQFPIYINDSGDTTVLDIRGQCRKIKSEMGLGLVVIDYLQLLRPHIKNPSREQQISEMSRALKNMAKELECPVLALSQLNRGVESRPNKRPNTADLRESGAIEQDADVVMFIYRDEVYNPDTKFPGLAEVIVGKNRHGEIGTAHLAWVGPYTSFENLTTAPPNTEQ
jgi:replicative DNA helicase